MRKSSIARRLLGTPVVPPGLEHEHGRAPPVPWAPSAGRAAAEPLVLKWREPSQVGEALDLLAGSQLSLAGEIQPERAASLGIEMPLDNIADVRVQLSLRFLDVGTPPGLQ